MATAPSLFDAASGYYDLPPGKLATVVTSLEMHDAPSHISGTTPVQRLATPPPGVSLSKWQYADPDDYRILYRHVGEAWLWFSRLRMSDSELLDVIHDPAVDVYKVVRDGGRAEGLLELDFREPEQCEIAFFGLGPGLIGTGAGRWLMDQTLKLAWSKPITRVWVHTCTLDHPRALDFYRRSGLVPFKQQIEIVDDPRLDGTLPESTAPHIPLPR